MEKKRDEICHECSKVIFTTYDKYVLLGTYNIEKKKDELCYFHFKCFTKYFNDRVSNKAKAVVNDMRDKATSLFNSPQIAELLSEIKGSANALNMLKTPLVDLKLDKTETDKEDNGKRNNKESKKQQNKM